MEHISYTAVLLGTAGIAGSLETGSRTGAVMAAALLAGGAIGMAVGVKRKEKHRDGQACRYGLADRKGCTRSWIRRGGYGSDGFGKGAED